MTYNTIPSIKINLNKEPPTTQYGYAPKICAFGCFDSDTKIKTCSTKKEAQDSFGNERWADKWFNILYRGDRVEDILIYNTEWDKGAKSNVFWTDSIEKASRDLRHEDFDILIPLAVLPLSWAATISPVHNALRDMISKYRREYHKFFGIICGIDLNDDSDVKSGHLENWRNIWHNDSMYKAVITPIVLNGEKLDLCSSAIYHAQVTATQPVNKSETMMTYDKEYTGLSTVDHHLNWWKSKSVNFDELINNGFFTVKYKDRKSGTVQCVTNTTPTGYDMRIERSFNYILKSLGLDTSIGLGKSINFQILKGKIDFIRKEAIHHGLCTDIQSKVERAGKNKVKVIINVYFDDIIRTVETNMNININEGGEYKYGL